MGDSTGTLNLLEQARPQTLVQLGCLGFALACDLVVAEQTARFVVAYTAAGLDLRHREEQAAQGEAEVTEWRDEQFPELRG